MRAHEFLTEQQLKNADITKRQQFGTRGLNIYSDAERWNTDYTMNRLGMAVASTDGIIEPNIDPKSWIGKHKSTHPYTPEEQAMLKLAYKAIGARWTDVNKGDMESQEPPGGNTESPIKPFQGYPR